MSITRRGQILIVLATLLVAFIQPPSSKNWSGPAFAQGNIEGTIAFIRGGNIWIVNADSTQERQLTTSGGYSEPEWSPDLSEIAYIQTVTQAGKEVTQVGFFDLADQEEHVLVEPEPTPFALLNTFFLFRNPRWSPDGNSLYFLSSDGRVQGDAIRILNLIDGTQVNGLILHALSFDISPVDGRVVHQVFSNAPPTVGQGLNTANSDGTMERPLISIDEIGSLGNPRWSPTGDQIGFITYDHQSQLYSIGIVNSDGSERGLLITGVEREVDGFDWSPDGVSLVYASSGALYIYDSSTAITQNLTRGTQPSWSSRSEISPSVPPGNRCGIWKWDGPTEEKDLRIRTTLITEASEIDCRGAFRFHNETGVWGFGGYSLDLRSPSENTEVVWIPPPEGGSQNVLLTPVLDIELHATPINISSSANVSLQGEMTLSTVAVDSSIFLIRAALAFSPPGTDCVIPEEAILFTGVRVSIILTTVTQLAFRGDYRAAYREFLQIAEHFYEQSGEVMAEIGFDCAIDILQSVWERPAIIIRIGVDYLTWVPIVIFDYFKYQGQSAEVLLVYTPPIQPTQIIVFQPTGFTGQEMDGSCWTLSIASPRQGAWRCMSNSRIFDPCFSQDGETDYVICGALPFSGTRGFRLNLTEPLPEETPPSQTSSVLALELEDGTTCQFLTTGTLFEVEGNYFNYGCSDGSILLEVNTGEVWTATKARLSSDNTRILETVQVRIKIVWV